MGSIMGERFRSQANATWSPVASSFFSDAFEDFGRVLAASERRPRNEGDVILCIVVDNVIPFAIGKAIAVLHGNNGYNLARAFYVLSRNIR